MSTVQHLVVAWYGWLSASTQGPVLALQGWADQVQIAAVTVVVLGLIGAASPCQLTTNMGALAYACARPAGGRGLVLAGAYVLGKVTVYTLLGGAAVLIGTQLQSAAIPVVVIARKALGPLMIVVALGLLGVWRVRLLRVNQLALRLRDRLRASGIPGAFLLGIAFSFAFCPTLFWLFFGLTIPLGLRSFGGWTFPGLFAIGSSLPLIALTALVTVGATVADAATARVGRLERPLRIVAAAILVVAGVHDTLVYWAL